MLITRRVSLTSSYQSGGPAITMGEVGVVDRAVAVPEYGALDGMMASDVIRIIRPVVGATNVVNLEVYEQFVLSAGAWAELASGTSLSGSFTMILAEAEV